MTSWAVVADVWYLEPQERQPGEDAIQFAERVRGMICQQAGIKPVPWVGEGRSHEERKKMRDVPSNDPPVEEDARSRVVASEPLWLSGNTRVCGRTARVGFLRLTMFFFPLFFSVFRLPLLRALP